MKTKRLSKILKILKACCPGENVGEIKRAYKFVEVAFGDRKRLSGKTQLEHACNVAEFLADKKLPPDIIVAGLLHDILEYTDYTADDIAKKFGQKIARLIVGENKLDSLKFMGEERYAENLRRMFIAMSEDIQVVFIKFADRVDNLRTLDCLPLTKQRRLALESLYIYAPIAGRLGMDRTRRELEDLAFKNLYPKEFKKIASLIKKYKNTEEKCFSQIKEVIEEEAKKNHIKIIKIENRLKNIYSLALKMKLKQKEFDEVHDIAACRIIVPSTADCYALLGLIHKNWRPLPKRFKDFIAQPKPNFYRSLHTNVFFEKNVVEIQIRTPEMHEEAEYGVNAHWLYKEQQNQWQAHLKKQTAWLKELSLVQKELKNNFDLPKTIKTIRLDLFKNRIFVFTPKGDVIDLPDDATPLDFAYAIHSQLGHHYLSANINGKEVPMNCRLHSHDTIIIERSHDKPTVKKSWLNIVTTRRAKDEIKDYFTKNEEGLHLIA